MTYPPDTPPSTYRPDAGSGYLPEETPSKLSEDTSAYADGQSAFAPPAPPAPPASLGSEGSDSSTTDVAKQQAAEVGGTAAEAGQQVAGVAKEQAANVAGQAKDEAKNLLGQTKSELTSQAGNQQQRAAAGLRSLGNELQSMSSNSDGDGPASGVARQAATRMNSAASWLEDRDPGQVLSEIQRFARQRPGAFLGLAAAAGLLAGRLTRGLTAGNSSDQTSSENRSTSPTGMYDSQGAGMASVGSGWESTGTESYGTESYGTAAYGTEPYGTQPPGTQSYGTGVGSGQSFDSPTAPPAAWEQDPIPPAGDGGYGQPNPGAGEVGR